MKKIVRYGLYTLFAVLSLLIFMGADGCVDTSKSVDDETVMVEKQQRVYNDVQPAPFFEWSLQRDLWIQFYRSMNASASTWSYIVNFQGHPIFGTPSQGYPIPLDTQLTNPLQAMGSTYQGSVVEKPEPNGLFTSKNTRGTIIMSLNDDGTASPIYSEPDVVCFPYPVKWNPKTEMFERVKGGKPAVALTINKSKP